MGDMEPVQKLTDIEKDIDVESIKDQLYVLTPQQQVWIDYKAVCGIIVDGDKLRKMTVTELAEKLSVTRETLYSWQRIIPKFWEKVAKRRRELNSQEFLTLMHEKFKLQALSFKNWQVSEAWLINFDDNYKTPKLKVEHDISDNYAALLSIAAKDGIIDLEAVQEGEKVEPTAINPSASYSDQPAHPPTP